ncbi:MAG: polysaccharide deacetylase family protein [Bacteroidaceae bacterium]|nr:polysaccharide deacetylase family protein [Bacteroidaceae bacterium]
MNILSFDIEEWYIESQGANRVSQYNKLYDTLNNLLDKLDRVGYKATFFCVGQLAERFPEVINQIVSHGHEIGCHSNVHTWVDKMDEKTLRKDTSDALKALENVAGQRVVSYRAPAFSITDKNKWAVNVLAECGIENDASIFPTTRDFGGFPSFPTDSPCIISYRGSSLKEYPVGLTSFLGKKFAYSGGGYFRLLPYWFVCNSMKKREYNICYFHLADLIHEEHKMLSREKYEAYFKEPGTFRNRLSRFVKSNVGTGNAYKKLNRLLSNHIFLNINEADSLIDWKKKPVVFL